MTRDEVIALARLNSRNTIPFTGQFIFSDQSNVLAFAAAIEARVRADEPALRLVADIRFALGDDGKRMSDELVEYCRDLRKDAERYRWLLENYATGDGYDLIDDALNSGEADVYLSAEIDAAMQTQAPTGA